MMCVYNQYMRCVVQYKYCYVEANAVFCSEMFQCFASESWCIYIASV